MIIFDFGFFISIIDLISVNESSCNLNKLDKKYHFNMFGCLINFDEVFILIPMLFIISKIFKKIPKHILLIVMPLFKIQSY